MTITLTKRTHPFVTALATATANTDDYKSQLYALVHYAGQLRAYQLPQLNNPNQWPGGASAYQDTRTTWDTLTGTLQGWSDSTLTNLTALPVTLQQNSTQVVQPTLSAALSETAALISDPSSSPARNALMLNLSLLSSSFGQYSRMTTSVVDNLESQATVFDANSQTMQTIAANALKTAGNETKLITDLNDQIAALNSDITNLSWGIAGGSLVTAAGIIMGIVAIVLAPATGGVSLALLIPAAVITAGGILVITLDAIKIQQDKDAIDALNTQISNANADIALVNTMSTTLTGFADQTETMKSALSSVVAPWNSAESYFAQAISTINGIESPSTSDWEEVQTELTTINDQWTALMGTMPSLTLQPQVSPKATLQLGMTDAQISAAISAAGTVSLAQYLSA